MTLEAWDGNLALLHSGLGGSVHSQVLLSASCDISAREGHFFLVCSRLSHIPLRDKVGRIFSILLMGFFLRGWPGVL